MSRKDLSNDPHPVKDREDAWWYESNGGIEVVVERMKFNDTTIVEIPWRQIRAALTRKDRTP